MTWTLIAVIGVLTWIVATLAIEPTCAGHVVGASPTGSSYTGGPTSPTRPRTGSVSGSGERAREEVRT
jgi:hypothetical protein